jgi:hypothetical protein
MIAAMIIQGDGFKALNRALLLQPGIVLDSLVKDLQGFLFPTWNNRSPSDYKCAIGH